VVIDPKGENASICARRRASGSEYCDGLDQRTFVFDPFKASKVADALRATFNPLDALDPGNEEAVDDASRIADALVVTSGEEKDPFWNEQARTLIKNLILHV
jgi:type IV secretion system protein VirD4